MALFTVRPTRLDRQTAAFVADHTDRAIEQTAGTLTWGADEHVMSAMALGWWIYCRNKDAPARRRSDHILLTTIAAAILPHLIKKLVNQERPDRLTIYGRLHGVPLSGKNTTRFLRAMRCTPVLWLPQRRRCLRRSAIRFGQHYPCWSRRVWCCWRTGRAMSLPGLQWASYSNAVSGLQPDSVNRAADLPGAPSGRKLARTDQFEERSIFATVGAGTWRPLERDGFP